MQVGLSRGRAEAAYRASPQPSTSSFVSENHEQLWLGAHLCLASSESRRSGPAGNVLKTLPLQPTTEKRRGRQLVSNLRTHSSFSNIQDVPGPVLKPGNIK